MKRFIAAAIVAAAVVPATAGAVPPGNSGAPAGSGACVVVGTPASPTVGSSCNFTGTSGGVGYGGFSSAGFALTHIELRNVCADDANGVSRKTGVTGVVAYDDQATWAPGPSAYFAEGPTYAFAIGRVYTLTIRGVGFGAAGGQSTPGASSASEPATPSAPAWAGADTNGTGNTAVGDPC